jgi:hypothetical protein
LPSIGMRLPQWKPQKASIACAIRPGGAFAPVVDVLEAQGRIARPQSYKDGADPYKIIEGGLYSDTPSGKPRMVLYGS